jgi:rhodanese-related sulfurtransferase
MRVTVLFILLLPWFLGCKTNNPGDASRNIQKTEKRADKEIPDSEKALPRLVVKDGITRDLGKVREGIITSIIFKLINEGEADALNISIHDLSQGGCTAVSQISELAAGDSAMLEFIFETLGYGGRKETRQVKIRYDNPDRSPITLTVTAEISPTEAYQVAIGELYYNFFVLADIRDGTDFRKGHIAGSIHVPKDEVLSWASALPRDFMIYLCSKDGTESDTLAKELQKDGYTEVYSIIGGIEEWKHMYGDRTIIQGVR